MMAELAARLPAKVEPIEAAGLNGDMLEAQAFGYLAVRVLYGMPTSAPMTTGVPAAVGGGESVGFRGRKALVNSGFCCEVDVLKASCFCLPLVKTAQDRWRG